MSSATDIESGQGAQAAPRARVGGSDSALPVLEAQPVISQAETLDEISSSVCCCIPSGVFRPFTSMRGGSNIDHSQRNVSDQSTQIGQGSSQAEAQILLATLPQTPHLNKNLFWFMSLVFSLLAALLAILVQQWVRDYMHVFQRYRNPLKSSRLRQYLYEGCEGWYMPMVAEAIPGFLHISLFLFFAGLGDSPLNINTKVALSTIVPIGVSGLLYIFTIFAPIIYPQSPYQNSFSSIFRYLFQKSCSRRFRDRGSDREMKPVGTNMAQGQMQLTMEEMVAREGRE